MQGQPHHPREKKIVFFKFYILKLKFFTFGFGFNEELLCLFFGKIFVCNVFPELKDPLCYTDN